MNILIVGGAGFLGRNMNKVLKDKNTVHCCDIVKCEEYDYAFVEDVNNTDKIINYIAEHKIEMIIYAVYNFQNSSNSEIIMKNLLPLTKLLDSISKLQVNKFIFISSAGEVYGNNCTPNSVDDELNPVTVYGYVKGASEMYVKMLCVEHGIDYAIIRPSNPFGELHDIASNRGFINITCKNILLDNEVVVVNDGNVFRDFLPISYYNEMFKQVIENDLFNDTYNFALGKSYSLNEILIMIESVIGKRAKIKHVSDSNVKISENHVNIDHTLKKLNLEIDDDLVPFIVSTVKYVESLI